MLRGLRRLTDGRAPSARSRRGTTDVVTIPLGRRGRRTRLLATAVLFGALVAGSAWGDDVHFPFGPFRMYASTEALDGVTSWYVLVGVGPDGVRHEIPTSEVGLRRAELEGRVAAIVRPSPRSWVGWSSCTPTATPAEPADQLGDRAPDPADGRRGAAGRGRRRGRGGMAALSRWWFAPAALGRGGGAARARLRVHPGRRAAHDVLGRRPGRCPRSLPAVWCSPSG